MEKGLEEYESNSGSSLPAWNGRKENMILKDGHYELTLDLSSCPQLKTQTGSSRIKLEFYTGTRGK